MTLALVFVAVYWSNAAYEALPVSTRQPPLLLRLRLTTGCFALVGRWLMLMIWVAKALAVLFVGDTSDVSACSLGRKWWQRQIF